jgi:hypothetical protein
LAMTLPITPMSIRSSGPLRIWTPCCTKPGSVAKNCNSSKRRWFIEFFEKNRQKKHRFSELMPFLQQFRASFSLLTIFCNRTGRRALVVLAQLRSCLRYNNLSTASIAEEQAGVNHAEHCPGYLKTCVTYTRCH